MAILVTGGNGFIGSRLVGRLVSEGRDVTVIDKRKAKRLSDANFFLGRVGNKKILEKVLPNIDTIYHEAAIFDSGVRTDNLKSTLDHNIMDTTRMLQTIINNKGFGIKKIILASSMVVYGEGKYKCKKHGIFYPILRTREELERGSWEIRCPKCYNLVVPLPIDENVPVRPGSIYAISKKAQEDLCLRVGEMLDIKVVILRYFNVYGPGINSNHSGVYNSFIKRLSENKPLVVYEDGLISRDFVYVDDIIQANLLVMNRNVSGIFNVGSGERISLIDLAREMNALKGMNLEPFISGKFAIYSPRHCFADISKLKNLGYRPTRLKIGLRNSVMA